MFKEYIHTILIQQSLQSVLWQEMQNVSKVLQGPTLVYHDGSFDVNLIIQTLTDVLVAKGPCEMSSKAVPRSYVLTGPQMRSIIPTLRDCPLWHARTPVLLVEETGTNAQEWLQLMWTNARAVNVVLMAIGPTVEYFTWFPYKPDECDNVTTITKLKSSDLFPEKITPNHHQCPLSAVVSIFPPMIIDYSSGVEIKLYFDLVAKINASALFVSLPKGEVIWRMYDTEGKRVNGNKMLYDNQVDLMFGTTGPNRFAPINENLRPHTIDSIVWFVPGELPKSHLDAIFRALPPTIWWLVITTCLLIYAIDILFPFIPPTSDRRGLLSALAINLNLPSNAPRKLSLKFLMIISYVYSLHITTAYQSSLIIFLSTEPREKPVATWEELAASGYKTIIHEGHKGMLSNSASTVLRELEKPERTSYTAALNLKLVSAPSRTAMLGPKITFSIHMAGAEYFDAHNYPTVRVIQEEVFYQQLGFVLSKGHPLQPLLDQYTGWLIEAGVPRHYIDELTPKPHARLKTLSPLIMEDVLGPLLFMGVLLTVASSAFAAEILLYRMYI